MQELVRFAADDLLVIILLIAAPVILFAIRKRFWDNAPVIIMAALTSLFVGKLFSLIYQPAVARPFLELGVDPGAAYIDNPGFPSDHALFATVVVAAVYFATKNKLLTAFLFTLVLAMGVARVVALVHTPLDIAGGVVAGLCGIIWYKKLTK